MNIKDCFPRTLFPKGRKAEDISMNTIVLVIIIIIVIAVVLIFAFTSFSGSNEQIGNLTFLGQSGSNIAKQNATDLLK